MSESPVPGVPDPPPAIYIDPVQGGRHCEYLRLGDSTLPIDAAEVEQINFVVSGDTTSQFIVLEFDARTFGQLTAINATLTVSGSGSIVRSPVPSSLGWQHYKMSLAYGGGDTQASISFVICRVHTRLDVDNVVVHSAVTNPCLTPGAVGCNMAEVPSFDVCLIPPVPVPMLLVVEADPFKCRCTADFDENKKVDIVDFNLLLAAWGQSGCSEEDLDCDGNVGSADFVRLLLQWGDCGIDTGGGAPASGSGSQAELELAIMAMGFTDLAAYQDWLLEASDAEALASGYVLAALLSG